MTTDRMSEQVTAEQALARCRLCSVKDTVRFVNILTEMGICSDEVAGLHLKRQTDDSMDLGEATGEYGWLPYVMMEFARRWESSSALR